MLVIFEERVSLILLCRFISLPASINKCLVEQYFPKFSTLTKEENINIENPDFLSLNTTLSKGVQIFILNTK